MSAGGLNAVREAQRQQVEACYSGGEERRYPSYHYNVVVTMQEWAVKVGGYWASFHSAQPTRAIAHYVGYTTAAIIQSKPQKEQKAMKRKAVSLLMLGMLAFAMGAQAGTTAADLAKNCRLSIAYTENVPADLSDTAKIRAGQCLGMMEAIEDMNAWFRVNGAKNSARMCKPATVTKLTDLAKVFIKYVEEHPEEQDKSGAIVAQHALRVAFPCKPV